MPNSPKSTDGAPLAPSAAPEPSATTAGDQHHPGAGIAPESDVRVHSPSSAAPLPSHGRMQEDLGDLPANYGDARLVGMVRDPTTLFFYWDFSPSQLEQAFTALGEAHARLKLWSSRAGAGELVREVEVHLDARGWYVRDLPPGADLRAELWAVGEKGARMLRAARRVKLPPAAPSDQIESFFLNLGLDESLREGVRGGRARGADAASTWDRRLQPRAGSSEGAPFGSGAPGKLPRERK